MYTKTRQLIVIGFIATTICHTRASIDKEGSTSNNPWVYNVPQAFANIPVRTKSSLSAWTNDIIKPPRYMQTLANRYEGIWGGLNHFQSIKRLPAHLGLGNYIVCAGADPHTPESQLFVIHLASQENNGSFKKNITRNSPPATDKIIKKISLSKDFWYAGSMDMAGAYLAVPVYKNNSSQILFYKISSEKNSTEPAQPINIEDLHIAIDRPTRNASAVAFTRLADGYYFLAVWTHGINDKEPGLDCYSSKDTEITHGFKPDYVHIPTSLFCNYKGHNDFQNINFVHDFDGSLYLLALANNPGKLLFSSNEDRAYLFEIRIRTLTEKNIKDAKKYDPHGLTAQLQKGTKRAYVLYTTHKHMFCKQDICSFASGATIYIPDQQHIYIYSLPYWLVDHGKQLTFAQYASIQKTYPLLYIKA